MGYELIAPKSILNPLRTVSILGNCKWEFSELLIDPGEPDSRCISETGFFEFHVSLNLAQVLRHDVFHSLSGDAVVILPR